MVQGLGYNNLLIDCNGFTKWQTDQEFINTGENKFRQSKHTSLQFNAPRFFPKGSKNCYKLPQLPLHSSYDKFIVRAGFFYGNHDGLASAPPPPPHTHTKLSAGGGWAPLYHELIKIIRGGGSRTMCLVCLVRFEGGGIPFISSLEATGQMLDSYKFLDDTSVFHIHSRINYGANASFRITRGDEINNRIWKRKAIPNYLNIHSTDIPSGYMLYENDPPWPVMACAIQAHNVTDSINLTVDFSPLPAVHAYFVLYFYDHIYKIYIDNRKLAVTDVPVFARSVDARHVVTLFPVLVFGSANVTISPAEGSTPPPPPLLNAMEVFSTWQWVCIDSGSRTSYTAADGILWQTDDSFIKAGTNKQVSPLNYSAWEQMNSLRVFDKQNKNCYTLPVTQTKRYFFRAMFKYGNYDGQSRPPTFRLEIDGNEWTEVDSSTHEIVYSELIYSVIGDEVSICLTRTQDGQFPFISSLEAWPLSDSMYQGMTRGVAWLMSYRYNYGTKDRIVGYPDDDYNRIWEPSRPPDLAIEVADTTTLYYTAYEEPPDSAIFNAVEAQTSSESITLQFEVNKTNTPTHILAYFTEMTDQTNETRSFDIYADDEFKLNMIPEYQNCTAAIIDAHPAGTLTIELRPTSQSSLPPIISAIEVYTATSPLVSNGTSQDDLDGLAALIDGFEQLEGWSGEPCLPNNSAWEWLGCSSSEPPRVLSIIDGNPSQPHPEKRNTALIIGLSVGLSLFIILAVVVAVYLLRWHQRQQAQGEEHGNSEAAKQDGQADLSGLTEELPQPNEHVRPAPAEEDVPPPGGTKLDADQDLDSGNIDQTFNNGGRNNYQSSAVPDKNMDELDEQANTAVPGMDMDELDELVNMHRHDERVNTAAPIMDMDELDERVNMHRHA
ncbi:Non-specific serine/threonine protein kinase [Bertholletia excelsa]